jgi:hypothetical protein
MGQPGLQLGHPYRQGKIQGTREGNESPESLEAESRREALIPGLFRPGYRSGVFEDFQAPGTLVHECFGMIGKSPAAEKRTKRAVVPVSLFFIPSPLAALRLTSFGSSAPFHIDSCLVVV